MRWVERIREWIASNERGLMTTGTWVLAAFCLCGFVYYVVKCYYLLR